MCIISKKCRCNKDVENRIAQRWGGLFSAVVNFAGTEREILRSMYGLLLRRILELYRFYKLSNIEECILDFSLWTIQVQICFIFLSYLHNILNIQIQSRKKLILHG